MLTSGCVPPLPEDWCLHGMEWAGRKVFEREFWQSESELVSHWVRIIRCGVNITGAVDGSNWADR
jgi:protein SMG6